MLAVVTVQLQLSDYSRLGAIAQSVQRNCCNYGSPVDLDIYSYTIKMCVPSLVSSYKQDCGISTPQHASYSRTSASYPLRPGNDHK